MENNFFDSNGVRISYVTEGEGAPIILCHGNGESSAIFSSLIGMLSKSYKVYAIDSRSHGQSEHVESLHYDDMADDILNLILHEEMDKRPIIIGFSDGGIAALQAAIKSGGIAFSKIIIAGASLNPKGLKLYFRAILKVGHWLKKSEYYRLMLEEPDIDPSQLGIIDAPVLVLAGDKDIIKEEHTRLIANSLKNATLKILYGEQHDTYVVNNKKFYTTIEEFLSND